MFCPKCGRRNEGDYKFCRGCGENLQAIAKAVERHWLKLLNRALDRYIKSQNRKLPNNAKFFRIFRWPLLMFIGLYSFLGLFRGDNRHWWVIASYLLLVLLAHFWDYVSFQRLSATGSRDDKSSAQAANLPKSAVELPSAPTTNELAPPFSAEPTTNELATPFSVTEPTTRLLEPLTAEKRSGDLL